MLIVAFRFDILIIQILGGIDCEKILQILFVGHNGTPFYAVTWMAYDPFKLIKGKAFSGIMILIKAGM